MQQFAQLIDEQFAQNVPDSDQPAVIARAAQLYDESYQRLARDTDRMFAVLLILQWIGGIIATLIVSPRTWIGATPFIHIHLWVVLLLGVAINSLPLYLAFIAPGQPVTRHVIASAQMFWSIILIHVTGGRIETHFHVFGSLAFLAFYRDIRVLITATIIVAVDHFVRGVWWPQSVFGVFIESPWRWVEHAAWVIFEDVILIKSCLRGTAESKLLAQRQADVEYTNQKIEEKVLLRTQELSQANEHLKHEITERERVEGERKQLEVQLQHQNKLEAVGQLAAGIAHEINTPVQFVSDNTHFLRESFIDIRLLFEACIEAQNRSGAEQEQIETFLARIGEISDRIDIDYLKTEIPNAIDQSLEGLSRVTEIVRAMKEFSHPGVTQKQAIDLNDTIRNTITVSRNEWKYVAEIDTDFDQQLPHVQCHPGEIGQVMLNFIINAAHTIGDKMKQDSHHKGLIRIKTGKFAECVEITIADNGMGIPREIQPRIFDPFFTTKEVGKGTGQGLAIAHSVIVHKHGGTIMLESEPGQGTMFCVRLPLEQELQTARIVEIA